MLTSLVPRPVADPTPANFLAPWRRIHAAWASVSPFWTVVGASPRPRSVGYGGRMTGMPRSPASEARSAVSSPATSAPDPSQTLTTHEKSVPSTRYPARWAASASAMAARSRSIAGVHRLRRALLATGQDPDLRGGAGTGLGHLAQLSRVATVARARAGREPRASPRLRSSTRWRAWATVSGP